MKVRIDHWTDGHYDISTDGCSYSEYQQVIETAQLIMQDLSTIPRLPKGWEYMWHNGIRPDDYKPAYSGLLPQTEAR